MKKPTIYNGTARVESHDVCKEVTSRAFFGILLWTNMHYYIVNTSGGSYEIKSLKDLYLNAGELIKLSIKRPKFKTLKRLESVLEETEIELPAQTECEQKKHIFKRVYGEWNSLWTAVMDIKRVDEERTSINGS